MLTFDESIKKCEKCGHLAEFNQFNITYMGGPSLDLAQDKNQYLKIECPCCGYKEKMECRNN